MSEETDLVSNIANTNLENPENFMSVVLDVGEYENEILVSLEIFSLLNAYALGTLEGAEASRYVALIEALLVHVRVLTSFFYPTGRRHSDDIYGDALAGESPNETSNEGQRLTDLRKELDKRLAHLTRGRRDAYKGYRLVVIIGDLLVVHQWFIDRLEIRYPGTFDFRLQPIRDFREKYNATYLEQIAENTPS